MAKAIGFDQLQGYYFSEPIPIHDAEALLSTNNVFKIKTKSSSRNT